MNVPCMYKCMRVCVYVSVCNYGCVYVFMCDVTMYFS